MGILEKNSEVVRRTKKVMTGQWLRKVIRKSYNYLREEHSRQKKQMQWWAPAWQAQRTANKWCTSSRSYIVRTLWNEVREDKVQGNQRSCRVSRCTQTPGFLCWMRLEWGVWTSLKDFEQISSINSVMF